MRWRRLLLIILGTIGITGFFLSFPYFYSLERDSPHKPLSAAQQIYELSDHGYLFYVTREQYWRFHILVWGGWSCGTLELPMESRP